MLEMHFAGVARFIGPAPIGPYPDNFDASPERQASAASAMPGMPVSGVNWVRHIRKSHPAPTPKRPTHLTVIK